jgi:hypothetical protein
VSQIYSHEFYEIGCGVLRTVCTESLLSDSNHRVYKIYTNWYSKFHIFFEEQITVYKFLTESFILTFSIMYFAGRCCKHWQCDVLRHHRCCGMWPCFTGWLRQCVGLSFKGQNVSEVRICRKNIFWKLVAVVNRNMYKYLLTLGNFDISTSQNSMTNYSGVIVGLLGRWGWEGWFWRCADHSYSNLRTNGTVSSLHHMSS